MIFMPVKTKSTRERESRARVSWERDRTRKRDRERERDREGWHGRRVGRSQSVGCVCIALLCLPPEAEVGKVCEKNKITEIKNGRTRGSFKSCHKHLIRSKHDLKAPAKRISHFAISSLPRVQIKSEFNCRQELSQQWLIDFFTNEIALGSPLKEVQPFNPQHFLPSHPFLHPLLWAAVAAAAVALSQRLINVTDICQVGFHNFVRFPSPAY